VRRVFLAAAPTARAVSLPALISGFEADVEDDAEEVVLAAVGGEDAWLVARPTGARYRDLALWEARLPGGWD